MRYRTLGTVNLFYSKIGVFILCFWAKILFIEINIKMISIAEYGTMHFSFFHTP